MARAKANKAKPTAKKTSKTSKASGAKKPAAKPAAKASKAKVAKKTPKAPSKKAKPAARPAVKKAAPKAGSRTKKVAAKKTAPKKTAAKKAVAKPAKKAVAKQGRKAPAKKVAPKKPAPKKAAAKKTVVKNAKDATKKVAPKKPATEKPVPVEKKKAGIAEVKAAAVRLKKKVSKRGRRRQRVTPTSTPLANWIPKDGLRPSSFLPAPPRAHSAFTVAAAPASSDRLVRAEDLAPPAPIRTIPVLVFVTQEGGRIQIRTNPITVEVAPGDAVEWDFRYSGGSDVLVTQVAIEISRPSPFGKTSYKSAKPGSARPHRHVSDLVKDKALGTTTEYTIHCTNAFKTELATGQASIVVQEPEPIDVVH